MAAYSAIYSCAILEDNMTQDEEKEVMGGGRRGVEEEGKSEGESVGEVKKDGGGVGKDSAVFNLGVTGLTENMEKLLSLGLKFVPVQKVNRSKVEADVERLKVKLMWNAFWKWKADFPGEEGESQEGSTQWQDREDEWRRREDRQRERVRKFEGKTTRMPTALPNRWKEAIGKYCEAVKEDIFRGMRKSPKDNLSVEARTAMKGIQERVRRKEWAVRPADKGGGITVEPYEDVVGDGQEELKDETTFRKLEKLSINATIGKVERKLKEMRDKGYITTKMRDNLSAKNTKEGTMKINRKVHKKLKGNGIFQGLALRRRG